MKKILFTDDLTCDVLAGIKTETRRVMKPVSENIDKMKHFSPCREGVNVRKDGSIFCYFGGRLYAPMYKVGEIVAVAQRYRNLYEWYGNPGNFRTYNEYFDAQDMFQKYGGMEGKPSWTNKMFVRAEDMPHQIQFTGIRAELLRDISDESCMKEGIVPAPQAIGPDILQTTFYTYRGAKRMFYKPQDAFAELIDRTCGRGAWLDNPFTFVYQFRLVK